MLLGLDNTRDVDLHSRQLKQDLVVAKTILAMLVSELATVTEIALLKARYFVSTVSFKLVECVEL